MTNPCSICGTPISENAERCLACVDKVATHFMLTFTKSNVEAAALFRISDGMWIGSVNAAAVVFGVESGKESRVFCDHAHAVRYLRRVADRDLVGPECLKDGTAVAPENAIVESRPGDKTIIIPDSARDFGRFGAGDPRRAN